MKRGMDLTRRLSSTTKGTMKHMMNTVQARRFQGGSTVRRIT